MAPSAPRVATVLADLSPVGRRCRRHLKPFRSPGRCSTPKGGLAVDSEARVFSGQGTHLPNLFAAGGAAAGVSGSLASGYLSGNGLLTATVLGRIAGESAAKFVNRNK